MKLLLLLALGELHGRVEHDAPEDDEAARPRLLGELLVVAEHGEHRREDLAHGRRRCRDERAELRDEEEDEALAERGACGEGEDRLEEVRRPGAEVNARLQLARRPGAV